MFSEQILRHICLSTKTVRDLQIKDQEEQYLSETCQLGFSQTPTSEIKEFERFGSVMGLTLMQQEEDTWMQTYEEALFYKVPR